MKLFKTGLCILMAIIIGGAAIAPGIREKYAVESLPTMSALNEKALNNSEQSDSADSFTHAILRDAALSDESLKVTACDDGDFYCDASAAEIDTVAENVGFVADEIILMFEYSTLFFEKAEIITEIGGKVVGYSALLNKYQIKIDSRSFDELQLLCDNLMEKSCVALACPNMAFKTAETAIPNDPWTDKDGFSTAIGWDESYPNGGNWWLEATQAISAWDYNEYFNKIKVGIVDSGFYVGHEDLEGKISFPSKFFEKRNVTSSHGTHVAGIISANANNSKGITGVCDNAELICADWQPDDNQYWATSERIATGFIAVVKSGAKVINFSLGSSSSYNKSLKFFWDIGMNIEAMFYSFIMARLLSKGYDFIVVQSAGNGTELGTPCDAFYNGNFTCIRESNVFTGISRVTKKDVLDRIIVVGSANSIFDGNNFYQSSFSNYGDTVDIFAPGSSVFSCDIPDKGNYSYKSGTSMATPVVTGIAALTWSVNPSLTGAQVRNILCDKANTKYDTINYFNKELFGDYTCPMVNALLSVKAAIATLPEETTTPTSTETETETVTETTDEIAAFSPTYAGVEAPLYDMPESAAVADEIKANVTPELVEQYRNEVGE